MDRLRRRVDLPRLLRLAGAATTSYAAAVALVPESRPVLAPLTALLVVHVTLVASLMSSLQRVVSVVAGVLLAVAFSALVGLTVWSLGLLVAVALLVGQLLKLGDHLLEVPISAMLVLAVGGASGAASERVLETLVGAAVGAAVNILLPPAVRTRDAGAAVERYAARLARVLERAADDLDEGTSVERATERLQEARRLDGAVVELDRELVEAERSRRLNARALLTPRADATLRTGLDALEHTAVDVRSLFHAILDGVSERPESVRGSEAQRALATLLRALADTVRAFGGLLRAETAGSGEPDPAGLATALEALHEARALLTELLLVDPQQDLDLWELNGSLLATVDRVLRELDVEAHLRRRQEYARDAAAVQLRGQAAQRIRSGPATQRRPRLRGQARLTSLRRRRR